MIIFFSILFGILVYLTIEAVDDALMCNKFKKGYTFDTYELVFHTTETYKLLSSYKIVMRKNEYILVQNVKSDELEEFDIIELLHRYDKIIIRDDNGNEFETFYKLNPYQW